MIRHPGLSLIPPFLVLFAVSCSEPAHLERSWSVMGTYASAEIYTRTAKDAEEVMEEIRESFERVDASMSNWRPDSELSRLNREAASGPYKVEDLDLYRCIKMAVQYGRATDGAFDPTVGPLMRLYGFRPFEPRIPGDGPLAEALEHVGWEKVKLVKVVHAVRFEDPEVELDLGGIAKGYALDVAARAFARVGSRAGLLDLGGSLYAWSHPPDRPFWTVGIRDPDDPSRVMATVDVASRAAATSGNYENAFTLEGRSYGHIMEAESGRPARSDIIAATALADSGADADAMSTAMFVAGSRRSSEFLRRASRVEAVLLVDAREGPALLVSASLKGRLHVDPEFRDRIGGRVRFLLPPLKLEGAEEIDLWERLLR